MAAAIAKYRAATGAIQCARQLSSIIIDALPANRLRLDRQKGAHPARKVFQAIRIYVNDELKELESGLNQAHSLLAPNGLLAVVTFHSLECQIVKRFFAKFSKDYWSTGKINNSVLPSEAEIRLNSRSKAGRLRYAYRIA